MTYRRSMPIWLLLAWLAVDAALYGAARFWNSGPLMTILWALAFSHFVLFTGWLAIGHFWRSITGRVLSASGDFVAQLDGHWQPLPVLSSVGHRGHLRAGLGLRGARTTRV
jgi:hypothetical protein